MALINCPECTNSISETAESCPYCGHRVLSEKEKKKIKADEQKEKFKNFSDTIKGVIVLIFIIIVLVVGIGICTSEDKPSEPAKPKTQAELRQEKIDNQFSAWDGSHRNLETLIKQGMNDPDSYEHVKTTYLEQGDNLIVTTQFRGKNAFGGVVLNSVIAKTDLDGNVIKIISQ